MWFLDHNYLENMTAMFRKVNGKPLHHCTYDMHVYVRVVSRMCLMYYAFSFPCTHLHTSILVSISSVCLFSCTARERIVGWYHTGPKLHPNDIAIHDLIGKYCVNPVSTLLISNLHTVHPSLFGFFFCLFVFIFFFTAGSRF